MASSELPDFGLTHLADDETGFRLRSRKLDDGGSKERTYDIQSDVTRKLEAARSGRERVAGSMKLGPVGVASGLLDLEGLNDPLERALRHARTLIEQERYDEAISALEALLAQHPGHFECFYLLAWCHSRREPDDQDAVARALRLLLPLLEAAMEHDLSLRVAALRDELHELRRPWLVECFEDARDDPARLVPFLREEVELAPTFEFAHFLLACALLTNDDYLHAVEAAANGISRIRTEEREELQRIHDIAGQLLAEQLLQPALESYRRRRYAQALDALSKIGGRVRESRLFMTFEAYVTALSRKNGLLRGLLGLAQSPAEVPPTGTSKDVEQLGFFIARREIQDARVYLTSNPRTLQDLEAVEHRLQDVLQHAPWFPYLHYLCGQCIYERLVASIQTPAACPTPEDLLAGLRSARERANIATSDPEILDAPAFLQMLDACIAALAKAKEEAAKVQAAIKAFNEIMQSVRTGINGAAHYREVRERLLAVSTRAKQLLREVASSGAHEMLTKLVKVTGEHLTELEKLKDLVHDEELLSPHRLAFKNKMEYLTRLKISSYSDLVSAREFFQGLLLAVERDKPRLKEAKARAAAEQLMTQIRGILLMLERKA